MDISNIEIAKTFNKLADLLEIEGANVFRVRAYRNAALMIGNMPRNVADLVESGADLKELPYIGADLAEKVTTLVQTGRLPALEVIEKRMPSVLSQLLDIEGLGPKRVKVLYDELHIHGLDDLRQAVLSNKISKIRNFGEKIQEKIKNSIEHVNENQRRFKLIEALALINPLIKFLEKAPGIKKVVVAGSVRRCKEVVGDVDLIVIAKKGADIIDYFIRYAAIEEVLAQGSARSSVRLRSGLQVDLRVMPAVSYGAALLYFTGSKAHNIVLRKIALQKNLKLNEYGLFKNKKRISGRTESDMYHQIGLPYIDPELREDRGEIEAALANKLPNLIKVEDIRGDLHCHTHITDGTATLEQMAMAAVRKKYEYLAVTEHSQYLTIAKGLDKKALLNQIAIIDELNEKLQKITILKSIELDILVDGSLDLPNEILKKLDLVIGAVHSHFHLSRQQQTERIIRAMDNPYFTIVAHPTGRLITKREAYEIDLEKIMQAAKDRHCFLELNAQPERMDLSDIYCKMAKDIGVKIAISTDAHSVNDFDFMPFGINQARRGWLTSDDVINTRNLAELRRLIKRY